MGRNQICLFFFIFDLNCRYGPLWIAITLVFLVSVAGNLNAYLVTTSASWHLDFEKISSATSLFLSLITIVPIGIALIAQQFTLKLTILQAISIFGYGLAIYVPVSFLCMVPLEIMRWLFLATAAASNLCFSYVNFSPFLKVEHRVGWWLLVLVGLIHLGVAIGCKFYFFYY